VINVCTTVFNRYDLLARQFESIRQNPVAVDMVYVIDRGNRPGDIADMARGVPVDIVANVGGNSLSAAWNWFLEHVPDTRLIVGEDVHFGPHAFHNVLDSDAGCMVMADPKSAMFSAFVLRDSVVNKVGWFDQTISPDYLYFEDWDYQRRMAQAGADIRPWYDVFHDHGADGCGTLGAKTPEQIADHHRRFTIARENFVKKWGEPVKREGYYR